MAIRQGAVPTGVGVDLGAVQTDRPEAAELVLARHLQHLHKGRFELLVEALAKPRQGVVVGMQIAGDEPKRQRVVGGPLDLAAGVAARGIAVDQQRQQHRGVVSLAALAGIRPLQFAQVQPFDHFHHVPGQMPFGQPLLYRRQQQGRVAVNRAEAAHGRVSSRWMALFYTAQDRQAARLVDRRKLAPNKRMQPAANGRG